MTFVAKEYRPLGHEQQTAGLSRLADITRIDPRLTTLFLFATMRFFTFCISADPEQPDIASGYVRAVCFEDSRVKFADDRANVYPPPDDFDWPAEAADKDVW
ncbi:MAG: hypothetical protein AAF681_09115 [Pseudomonadota bacterium]